MITTDPISDHFGVPTGAQPDPASNATELTPHPPSPIRNLTVQHATVTPCAQDRPHLVPLFTLVSLSHQSTSHRGFPSGRDPLNLFSPVLSDFCRCRLLSYGALAGGTLSGKYLNGAACPTSRHTLFAGFQARYICEATSAATALYAKLAASKGLTPTQLALGWAAGRWYQVRSPVTVCWSQVAPANWNV